MQPNSRMLAQNMAQHFQDTFHNIIKQQGRRPPQPWMRLNKQEKKDLTDTFTVILSRADREEMEQARPKNSMMDR